MTWVMPDYSVEEQRSNQVEHIGQVIGTCGTVPYIHLHLEATRQFFGSAGPDGLPTLVVNDGRGEKYDEPKLRRLCEQYGAELICGDYIGHTTGDIRVFLEGLHWAQSHGIDILAKFSRRFVPLESWRIPLHFLAAQNRYVAAFGRRNDDRPDGLFRTDAIALRVKNWMAEEIQKPLRDALEMKWTDVQVEPLMLSFTRVNGGWVQWDLVGEGLARPHTKAMQWRGMTPQHYGDLSRMFGLPYSDIDFDSGRFGTVDFELPEDKRTEPQPRCSAVGAVVLDVDEHGNPVLPAEVTTHGGDSDDFGNRVG